MISTKPNRENQNFGNLMLKWIYFVYACIHEKWPVNPVTSSEFNETFRVCKGCEGEAEAESNIFREIFFCCILGKSQMSFKFSKVVEIPLTKFLLSRVRV